MGTHATEADEIARIARSAGRILLRYFGSSTPVEWKSPGDPVTRADREASDFIVGKLRRLFPDDGILSEEMPDQASRLSRSRVWMVDPMDGTREFIAGREEFAVMIGLVTASRPTLGVIYHPSADKLYVASRGNGAFLENEGRRGPLHVSSESVASRMVIAVSRSHRSARVDRIAAQVGITEQIRLGSVGLKVGLMCEGRAHLYIHAGNQTHLWDTCAPEAILLEAGGNLTDLAGKPLAYSGPQLRNPNGVIASNGVVHARVVRAAALVIGG